METSLKTKVILLADAVFIGIAGTVQIIQELLGHFAQKGLYADILSDFLRHTV